MNTERPAYVRCCFDHPEYGDRYTVAFDFGDDTPGYVMYLAVSSDPTSPLGISQWGEWGTGDSFEEYREENSAHLIDWADLPEHIRAHVVARATED